MAEPAVTEGGIHGVELCMVPGVEGFQTQFQVAAARFPEVEPLEERQVPVVAARSAQIVVWQSSPIARGRNRKRCGTKPFVDVVWSRERARQVRAVIAVSPETAFCSAQVDVDR